MKDQKTKGCKNCEVNFSTTFDFCPHCGQKANDALTLRVLFYNTIGNYFAFDARFFKSFVPLMFKPGLVAKQFVEGKRLKYLHPAQYYLFVSIVFFFVASFQVRDYNMMANKAIKKGYEMEKNQIPVLSEALDTEDISKITDSIVKSKLSESSNSNLTFGYDIKKLNALIASGASEKAQLEAVGLKENSSWFDRLLRKQMLKFHKQEGGGIVQAISDTIPIAMFFLLPIFALILKFFYWKRGTYAHHLVFSFYYFSFLFIVLGFVLGVNYFLFDIPDWIDVLVVLSTFIYLWMSMKNFYQQGYLLTLLKASLSTFIYMVCIVPTAFIIILLASFLFY
ncbi:MAG: DUF3667 domain-containing protein [Flavobacteriaceae bacterium]|nr:DUF3667 domain-containing protein [Flavobacteriaceae bacterium]